MRICLILFMIWNPANMAYAPILSESEMLTTELCSLIYDPKDCNRNKKCMFVDIKIRQYPQVRDRSIMCLHKQFIVRALKARLFPRNFNTIHVSRLLDLAYLDRELDLQYSQNIFILVNTLIKLQRIDFIEKFSYIKDD